MTDKTNLSNESFFGEKPSLTAKIPESLKSPAENESTVEVKFCTGGRLSAPEVLHFYDYNMGAAQLLAELADHEEKLPVVAKVLSSMVVEDFDCGLLHREEIKEVLLNVHAKWWGSKLEGFRYFLNPEEEDREKLMARENISIASIPLSSLVVKPLAENIQEPINVVSHGVTVKLLFPRAQNYEITQNYLTKRFAVEEQKFFQIRKDIRRNQNAQNSSELVPVDPVLEKEYEDYMNALANERILVSRAQFLYGIGDEVFETLESRIEALRTHREISVDHWDMYNKFLENEGTFGLQDEVEFYSEILNQKIKRTFSFYSYNLIPVSMDRERSEHNSISFG